MAEIIDIFDANLEPIGTMERKQAHLEGKWHRTFHLWLADKRDGGTLIFQLRAPHVTNYPSMLDITAAGHLEAGENPSHGVREVKEELGLEMDIRNIHQLGYRVEVADQANGQKNREYQAVYMAQLPISLQQLTPDPKEVYGLIGIRIKDCYALFSGNAAKVRARGIRYDAETTTWVGDERYVSIPDFIPRVQQYYLTAAIMAERMLSGRFPLSIS